MSRADMQLLGRDLTSLSVALATGGIGSVELVGQVLAAVEASQALDDASFWQPAPLLAKLAAEGKSFS